MFSDVVSTGFRTILPFYRTTVLVIRVLWEQYQSRKFRDQGGRCTVPFYLFFMNPQFLGIKTLINVFWLVWVFQRAAGENFELFSSFLWIFLLKIDHFQRNLNPQFWVAPRIYPKFWVWALTNKILGFSRWWTQIFWVRTQKKHWSCNITDRRDWCLRDSVFALGDE